MALLRDPGLTAARQFRRCGARFLAISWLSLALPHRAFSQQAGTAAQRPSDKGGDNRADSGRSGLASSSASSTAESERRVDDLERRIQDLRDENSRLLTPVSVLIGILATGGAIGVVFSIRDQRRISQLHELAITGEESSQRRREDSYATFIDASQKTLALVNDTLQLAKEATQRANKTMTLRAERSLTAISQQAQDLLDGVLHDDFKRIVEDATLRTDLEVLAKELSSIEGYLSLQEIPLKPECLFVQGMNLHLSNDARGALRVFRQIGHEGVARDLRALAQYWIAYLHNNRGNYREALEVFRSSKQNLAQDSPRYIELERISHETEFFLTATDCGSDAVQERAAAVSRPMSDLKVLAASEGLSANIHRKVRERIASTRANVVWWAANVRQVTAGSPSSECRALLKEARDLYASAGEGLFPQFGNVEARFLLGDQVTAAEYKQAETKATDFLRLRREPRNTANIYETILIVRCRAEALGGDSAAAIGDAYESVQRAIGDIRDPETTVFSQIEKRNVSQRYFTEEVQWVFENMRTPRSNLQMEDHVAQS